MKYIYLLLFFPFYVSAQTQYMVRPNIADPLSGSPNNFHYIYINKDLPQKNKLFLFFPGTGGVPFNYREIVKHAANLGYHSIGLTYPNSQAINQICAASTDTTCHSRARHEVFDGVDRHADLTVDTNNCIQTRTLKLLQYLNNNYPDDNWGQYLSNDEIEWEKVIVSGHSQGGGHAGIISKIKKVDRVVMFAAMDWIGLLNRNADWITWAGPTPQSSYYGFTHEKDEFVDFAKIQTTWSNYGMSNFGNIVLVDTSDSPYNYTRQLFSLLTPANDTSKYHGSVVVDEYTPMSSGLPVFGPVWTYMIEGSDFVSTIDAVVKKEKPIWYPNPVGSILYYDCKNCEGNFYKIYSLQGKLIKSGVMQNGYINLSDVASGICFLKVEGQNFHDFVKIIIE